MVEKEITSLKHKNGVVEEIIFADNSTFELKAIYSRLCPPVLTGQPNKHNSKYSFHRWGVVSFSSF